MEAEKAREISSMEAEKAREKQSERIYDNCVIDKASDDPSSAVLKIIKRECQRIADDPSYWDKFKYSK